MCCIINVAFKDMNATQENTTDFLTKAQAPLSAGLHTAGALIIWI